MTGLAIEPNGALVAANFEMVRDEHDRSLHLVVAAPRRRPVVATCGVREVPQWVQDCAHLVSEPLVIPAVRQCISRAPTEAFSGGGSLHRGVLHRARCLAWGAECRATNLVPFCPALAMRCHFCSAATVRIPAVRGAGHTHVADYNDSATLSDNLIVIVESSLFTGHAGPVDDLCESVHAA
jgi:hypothetical protein